METFARQTDRVRGPFDDPRIRTEPIPLDAKDSQSGPGDEPSAFGAYGLIVKGAAGSSDWWNLATPDWTRWCTQWKRSQGGEAVADRIDYDTARVALAPEGHVMIDRERQLTEFHTPEPPSLASLLHPYLGSTAVIHAYWDRRDSFHGGAFVARGRAWALLGDREHGKSSTLAWLHAAGLPIVADDLIVLRGKNVTAGPRCMDLRESAAERFALGTDIGVVGNRRRWRVQLPAVESEMPLGGWVVLRWSDDGRTTIRPATVEEGFKVLATSQALKVASRSSAWLDLVSLPILVFERPKTWEALDSAMQDLLLMLDLLR